MFHIEFMDIRVSEVLLVSLAILFAHLQRVDDVYRCAVDVNVVLQRRDVVRIELAADGPGVQVLHAVDEVVGECQRLLAVADRALPLQLRLELFSLLLAFTRAGEHGPDEHGQKPRDDGTALVQVGGADEAVGDVDVLPLNQQSRKAAAEGRAVGPVHAPAVVFHDVCLDLLRHRQHVGEYNIRVALEAVVVDGNDVIFLREIVHHVLEVQLPGAGRAGEQQQRPAALISKFPEIHRVYRASFKIDCPQNN